MIKVVCLLWGALSRDLLPPAKSPNVPLVGLATLPIATESTAVIGTYPSMAGSSLGFDDLHWPWRLGIALLALPVAILPAAALVEAGYENTAWYLLFPLYLPFGHFGVTPLFRATGIYRYYSTMLVAIMPSEQRIALHSGGGFDYVFQWLTRGAPRSWRQWVQSQHLAGLLAIADGVREGRLPGTVVVTGSTYFLSGGSARRLGFSSAQCGVFDALNLWMNVLDILWMYSLARGRLAFPPLWRMRTFTTTGERLSARHDVIRGLIARVPAVE